MLREVLTVGELRLQRGRWRLETTPAAAREASRVAGRARGAGRGHRAPPNGGVPAARRAQGRRGWQRWRRRASGAVAVSSFRDDMGGQQGRGDGAREAGVDVRGRERASGAGQQGCRPPGAPRAGGDGSGGGVGLPGRWRRRASAAAREASWVAGMARVRPAWAREAGRGHGERTARAPARSSGQGGRNRTA